MRNLILWGFTAMLVMGFTQTFARDSGVLSNPHPQVQWMSSEAKTGMIQALITALKADGASDEEVSAVLINGLKQPATAAPVADASAGDCPEETPLCCDDNVGSGTCTQCVSNYGECGGDSGGWTIGTPGTVKDDGLGDGCEDCGSGVCCAGTGDGCCTRCASDITRC